MRAGWIKSDFQQSTARNVLKKHLDQTKNKTNFGSIEKNDKCELKFQFSNHNMTASIQQWS